MISFEILSQKTVLGPPESKIPAIFVKKADSSAHHGQPGLNLGVEPWNVLI